MQIVSWIHFSQKSPKFYCNIQFILFMATISDHVNGKGITWNKKNGNHQSYYLLKKRFICFFSKKNNNKKQIQSIRIKPKFVPRCWKWFGQVPKSKNLRLSPSLLGWNYLIWNYVCPECSNIYFNGIKQWNVIFKVATKKNIIQTNIEFKLWNLDGSDCIHAHIIWHISLVIAIFIFVGKLTYDSTLFHQHHDTVIGFFWISKKKGTNKNEEKKKS